MQRSSSAHSQYGCAHSHGERTLLKACRQPQYGRSTHPQDAGRLDVAAREWGLSTTDQRDLFNRLGDISVSTKIPVILEQITGCASAVVESPEPRLRFCCRQRTLSKSKVSNRSRLFCQHDPTVGFTNTHFSSPGHTPPSANQSAKVSGGLIQSPTAWVSIKSMN